MPARNRDDTVTELGPVWRELNNGCMFPLIHIDLIEDNPGDANLIRLMLEDHPRYQVQVSHFLTGKAYLEARQKAAPARPCVALLDYNLPGLLGSDVLRALRRSYDAATLPVLLMSGDPFLADQLVDPAEGVIVKPMDMLEWWTIFEERILSVLPVDPYEA